MREQGVLDITRARKELGYEPKFEFQAGIRDLVQAGRRLPS